MLSPILTREASVMEKLTMPPKSSLRSRDYVGLEQFCEPVYSLPEFHKGP